ncbi:MAG: thioesterase [Desulfuromonadales bacterium]|nr:thioesterase [Desulfuromonadales bacterium]NIR33115.1 thioesterase [Desulfuromonadales bacterium]NIS40603.1 thioesterase [Desulfuromonadales bacterium]
MTTSPEAITAYLHEHIPITAHLGVRVEVWDGETVRLAAPLEPNLNHRCTAFGGSLSALAILAGWTVLHLKLRAAGLRCRLVIQKSAFDFVEAVESDFAAVCQAPAEESWTRFVTTLRRRGRARIRLQAKVETAAGDPGGHYEGSYVALLGAEGSRQQKV